VERVPFPQRHQNGLGNEFSGKDRKGTSGPLRTGSGEIPSLAEAEPIEQIREELIRRR
jgi:hypothetical protein